MARAVVAAIWLLGLLIVFGVVVKLNDVTRTAGPVAVIPFKLHGSMIVVELAVDSSDPLSFIFDTAAGGTIISARTADRLGVIGEETVSREGATGAAEVVLSTKHTVSVGGLTLRNVTLGIAELDHIERRLGMRIDGVIGWPILSRYAVRVDYDAMQIELYEPRRFAYGLDTQGYDVEVSGTVFFVSATVGFKSGATFTGRVMVDTGSGGTISFNTPFARENDLLAEIGSSYERATQSLSTETARSYTAMLSSLSIDRHEFAGVPASITFAESGAISWPKVMGILGNGVLKRFNMVIDLKRQKVFLEPNRLFHEAFEVDCSGLELLMDDAFQKVIVDQVDEGSPADEAGLKVGDQIVLIDGASASDFHLPQIRSMLSQEGREVELLVDREGELDSYRLKLRPLIE